MSDIISFTPNDKIKYKYIYRITFEDGGEKVIEATIIELVENQFFFIDKEDRINLIVNSRLVRDIERKEKIVD